MTEQLLENAQREIKSSCKDHKQQYRNEVVTLLRDVEQAYTIVIHEMTSLFAKNGAVVPLLHELSTATNTYLTSMRWVGWGNCELGPPLGIYPVQEYALAMAVYTSARLIDDALDGHAHYKGLMPTLHNFLCTTTTEREASGLGSMMGSFVAQEAFRQLINKGYSDTALLLFQLYANVIPGAMAELCVQGNHSIELYNAIVQRKSVAYDMMLHHTFLRTVPNHLQTPLLQFLAEFSEVAQWLNDLMDREDDWQRQQLNFLHTAHIDEMTASLRIAEAFLQLWDKACTLPNHLRNALAMRLHDPITVLLSAMSQFTASSHS